MYLDNVMISIVQIVDNFSGSGEHFLQIRHTDTGKILSNEEYEAWLTEIGAECVQRF